MNVGQVSRLPRAGRETCLTIAFVFAAYILCPPFTSFDSYWTVPTALALIGHGTTAVDDYVASAPPGARYAVECVPPHATGVAYNLADGCPGGHWYNFYPVGVPLLALPLVFLVKMGTAAAAFLVPRAATLAAHPVLAAFLGGDLAAGHAVVELFCGAVFGAITVWLQYRIAALFLARRAALLVALIFAFGTSEWSVASRNLYQHGPSLLLLSLALYLILRAREEPSRISYAAFPLALSFVVRPSNCISVAALTVYVAIHYRAHLMRFLLWAVPVAAPFLAYNLVTRHSLFSKYYNAGIGMHYPLLAGYAMNLFSPSRGLLIFTPIVLFSFVGMVLAWRARWCFPLTPYLVAIVIVHSLFIAIYWPGHCYGPRYFTDMLHLFVFFLVPIVLYWPKLPVRARPAAAVLFLLLAAWGVFTHGRGATSVAASQWNVEPANVDQAQWRVWDWSDPQFLRGLK
ncbi:MAG TPA: hypothetical protein VE959_09060 [Bryobacteraceae bacterium]|nr:hypothetical protein [Bryobacteraceae bacterium]